MPAALRIPMIKDITQALMVLALVFLNFAHAPAASAYDGELNAYLLAAGTGADFCGEDAGDDRSHPPCHACRIGGAADLPVPAGSVMSAVGLQTAIVYAGSHDIAVDVQSARLPPPTGPPSA